MISADANPVMQLRPTPRAIPAHPLPALLLAIALLATGANASQAPQAHDEARCGNCHDGGRATAGTIEMAPTADRLTPRCLACHDKTMAATRTNHLFHGQPGHSCVNCHKFHDPTVLRAGNNEFSVTFDDSRTQTHCHACHQVGGQVRQIAEGAQFAASAVYHSDKYDLAMLSPSDGCLICHDSGTSSVTMPAHAAPIPRFNTHASHPYGIRFTPGQGRGAGRIRADIDPRLPLPDGKIECQTCHLIPSATKDLLVPFADPYAMCLGCHQVRYKEQEDLGPLALADGR